MSQVKKIPFKEFKKIYNKVPRLCVDLVIKSKNGIVFSNRDIPPAKRMWHLPGGTVLWNEKLKDTIKRVAEEETGLKVRIVKQIGVVEYSWKHALSQAISIAFLIEPVGGKLRGSSQAKLIKFFEEIPDNTIPEQVIFIKENKLL